MISRAVENSLYGGLSKRTCDSIRRCSFTAEGGQKKARNPSGGLERSRVPGRKAQMVDRQVVAIREFSFSVMTPFGTAPTTRSTTSPFWKNSSVGIDWMPKLPATPGT